MKLKVALLACCLVSVAPISAQAFCGFYVSGDDRALYNNATTVVMMREGTRTVLSMQNNYQGPPADFAMVVPVPVVLHESNVKTLPHGVFDAVDRLAAPRLVEYWEQDPCYEPEYYEDDLDEDEDSPEEERSEPKERRRRELGVEIEAQFTVGEYQIVILSARDSDGLDTWLREERYNIPAGAEPLLRPYVSSGMKFFVAKVDADKVTFTDGQAMLSPLRFHYDSHQFNLPIRLGLMNSAGTQDLLVHILSPGQRYEVANYDNVTIPTNLEVRDETRRDFGGFYAALFDQTLAQHPDAVVTEYAWQATKCDPCPPGSPLDPEQLLTLGGDVLATGVSRNYVLTRLHARYGKDAMGADLVFRTAPAIAGGRERRIASGGLERAATASSINNFQARYIIRHPWTGPVDCPNPRRGIWGGPPRGRHKPVQAAEDIAFVQRQSDISLASFLRNRLSGDDFKKSQRDPGSRFQTSGIQQAVRATPTPVQNSGGCAGCQGQRSGSGVPGLALLLAGVLLWTRARTPRTCSHRDVRPGSTP